MQILRTLAAIDWEEGEKLSAIARIEEAIGLLDAQENADADLRFELAKELEELQGQV